MATDVLLGRDQELDQLRALVAKIADRGASLLITGDAGLGKTALLGAVGDQASELDWLVLRTAGTPSEATLPLAALHLLLQPAMADLDRLQPSLREALAGAFGLRDTEAPQVYRIALAVLALLAELATRQPVAVIVDDAQWIDRSSAEVLAFVARRVSADRILVLAATRPHDDDPFAQSDVPELVLTPLSDAAARALLDSADAAMNDTTRRVMLAIAAGNPLALLELPKSLTGADLDAVSPGPLPLTERLERAFAARASVLPKATGDLLLLAAANDVDNLGEVLAAYSAMCSRPAEVSELDAAVSGGLLNVDGGAVHFRHPLMRSAIYQSAGLGQRRAAHAALAEATASDPDRCVWHRATAVVGVDAEIAVELDEAAARCRQRGDISAAVAALERAASLSATDVTRGRRLVLAAELLYEIGRTNLSERLLREAGSTGLHDHDQLRLEAVRELSDSKMLGGVARVETLIALAHRARTRNDTDLAAGFLLRAATRCWHLNFGSEVGQGVVAATDELGLAAPDPRRLVIHAYAAPFSRGNEVIDHLARRTPNPGDDPNDQLLLGHAAACVGAFPQAEIFCGAAADGLREQGRLALLAQALSLTAWAALRRSRWHIAEPAAAECVRLAQDTHQPIVQVAGLAAQAMLAAIRGEEDSAFTLAAQAERLGATTRNSVGLALIQTARAMSEAGAGRPATAFDHLWRIYQVDDPAHQRMQACWAIGLLAEVAAQSGQLSAAQSELAQFEARATHTSSEGVHIALRYARTWFTSPEDNEHVFGLALDTDLSDWPFEHARLLLAYGTWLRRQRRVTESRKPLRRACEEFERLGAVPWARRARLKLRASGESRAGPTINTRNSLSPQELQIAQLVADGLSNKEIAQRLYVSPRTVGSHLYRIFPKLGVTSRAQLAKALPSPTIP